MSRLSPNFEDVQAHYDLNDEFFALFLDPTRTYSCAYFERDDMTLQEAQIAKVDLSLDKCGLRAGMRMLDVGCGWGATVRRAAERRQVDAIGLTLSQNQYDYVRRLDDVPPGSATVEVRLMGWEGFHEPVDRIISIGAFEHFRGERHLDFFCRCHELLPEGGRMLLHTIVVPRRTTMESKGIPTTHEQVLFAKFIRDEIFPGGQLCSPEAIELRAHHVGFRVEQTQSLRLHYARTLDCWSEALVSKRQQAVELTSVEVYDRYVKYLTGCADLFRSGHADVMQFTLRRC